MNQIAGPRTPPRRPSFTDTQGQYLAFIAAYTLVNGRPPAETDMKRFFGVTPPSVHQMVLTLEKAGLISRTPRAPRRSLRRATSATVAPGSRLSDRIPHLLPRDHRRRPSTLLNTSTRLQATSKLALRSDAELYAIALQGGRQRMLTPLGPAAR